MRNKLRREIISKRLSEELQNCKISFADIAKQVGVNAAMISQYSSGVKMPSLETFSKICEVIEADANYILGLTDSSI